MLQGVGNGLRRGTGQGVPGKGNISVEPEGFLGGRQAEKPAAGVLTRREQQVQQIQDGGGDRECWKSARSPGELQRGCGNEAGSPAQGWVTRSLVVEGAWALCREPGTDAERKRSLGRFKLKQ